MDIPVKKTPSKFRRPKSAQVTHTNPRTDTMVAVFKGAKELSDRQHSRFQRQDVRLHVRPDSKLLNFFRAPLFRSAALKDISVSGACFQLASPIRTRRISLRVQFGDGAEFLLASRLLKRHKENIHRVKFLERDQAFVDHLLKSSLNLRFQGLD